MWNDLWAALALMLVIEGMLPFLSPAMLRARLLQLGQISDQSLRLLGLASMSVGIVLLYLLK
jgi:hypothetical protein